GAVPVLALAANATLADTLRTTDERELANRDLPPGARWAYAERPSRPVVRAAPRRKLSCSDTSLMQFALGSRIPIYNRSTVAVTQRFRGCVIDSFVRAATHGETGKLKDAPRDVQTRAALLAGKDEEGKP